MESTLAIATQRVGKIEGRSDDPILALIDRRLTEMEAAQPESAITNETRLRAIMSIQARAEQGDRAAQATWAAVEKLLRSAGSQLQSS
jgi:hypothetical protein